VAEINAIDQLHGEEHSVRLRDDQLVEPHEVAMADVRQDPKLLFQTVEGRGVERRQCLERDPLVAPPIAGLVNHPHPPSPDAANDLVVLGGHPPGDVERRDVNPSP
jgi:hypothetical protein